MKSNKKVLIETNKIINSISLKIEEYVSKDIEGKELIVMYDDILPDLFIWIPMNTDVMDRYDIHIPKKVVNNIPYVTYDVYAENIKRVRLEFPINRVEYYNVYWEKDSRDDEFYCCTWEVPMIDIDYNGVKLELSLLDLINKGVKVYIEKYEIGAKTYE